ncbi:MAG: bifunctional metallophosphatase/5'-nucleotidase [Erysipelotrichaceae bacterium]|nr:bifunctional metallophosphatase/5'-nucleotidase [Erysipelotrichaceae bacterium]
MNDKIKILMTSDVHAYVFPYSYADNKEEDHGFGKVSHTFRRLKDENTILIDNGDNLEGSPLAYYHFEKRKNEPNPFAKVMNAIGYDFYNLGNHDFNHGEKVLLDFMDSLNMPCLCANILYDGKPFSKPYHIRKVAGKTIAFFGVCTQHIPFWEKPENIEHMSFIDALECAKDICKQIKENENTDYVIGVYHGGFETDPDTLEPKGAQSGENKGYRMCMEIDNLDVLLCGHQHMEMCGTCNGTVYIQNAHNGRQISYIGIDPENDTIDARLINVDHEADPEILKIMEEEENDCQKWLDQPLGTSKVDLLIKDEFDARLHKSQVITFLNNVCFEATGADISANALFLFAKGFEENITMRDLVATYVFPNTLVVKKINGKILKEYLERDAQFWDVKDGKIVVEAHNDFPTPQHHNYDMLDGIEYTIKVSNPVGERIVSLTRNGIPVKDEDEFSLCINNYRAAGGGDYDMVKDAPTLQEIQRNVVEIIAEYIERHKVIDFTPVHNIKVEI